MDQLLPRMGFGVLAFAAMTAAMPAQANTSAATDFTTAARAATTSTAPATGDENYSKLFASWQALDRGGVAAAPGIATPTFAAPALPAPNVAIPSRVPVDGYRLSSSFGMRNHPVTGGRRAHQGLDLAVKTGTPIRAAADGVVEKANWFGAYGLYVALDHGGSMETRYGHMSRLNVAPGQRVRQGEIIGYVGSTGRSTGPHLHYEVRIAGRAVDPTPYMRMTEPAVTYAALGAGRGGPE
jgi:murein DD-endopeptidase MepM/ murein hydrolase activator NlpD